MTLAVHRLRLPLRTPLATAAGTIAERTLWLVAASQDGCTGWGEAAPLPGFGGEPPERCELALARAVEGRDPDHATPCALAAVADARLDLAARLAARPIAGRVGTVATARLAASDGEVAGGGTVKLKSCGDPVADAARVRALTARHPGTRLRLDANGQWDLAGAHAFARLAAGLVEFVEQPLPLGDLAGCAALRHAGLRLALDEGLRDADAIARAIAAQACDVAVLKPGWLGGHAATAALVAMIRLAGLDVVVSDALGSAVGRLHAAHLALALDLPGPHGLGTAHLLERDVACDGEADGLIPVRGPGLGISVSP